jgi:hypothetical protein
VSPDTEGHLGVEITHLHILVSSNIYSQQNKFYGIYLLGYSDNVQTEAYVNSVHILLNFIIFSGCMQ